MAASFELNFFVESNVKIPTAFTAGYYIVLQYNRFIYVHSLWLIFTVASGQNSVPPAQKL